MKNPKPVILTQEQLEKLCEEWKKILSLQAWEIHVKIVRVSEFANKNGVAHVHMEREHNEALIRILDPLDYPSNTPVPQDMEHSLVHELIHILWDVTIDSFDPAHEAHVQWERSINLTVRALLKLKRGK